MPDAAYILAKLAIPVATETILYSVPATNRCHIQGFLLVNTSGIVSSFRLAICRNGAIDHPADWIYFDLPVGVNDTFLAQIDILINPSDTIRVYSTLGGVSISLLAELI